MGTDEWTGEQTAIPALDRRADGQTGGWTEERVNGWMDGWYDEMV